MGGIADVEVSAAGHDLSILITAEAGEARAYGMLPGWKTSMIRIRPPQHGHSWAYASVVAGSAAAGLAGETLYLSGSGVMAERLLGAGGVVQ